MRPDVAAAFDRMAAAAAGAGIQLLVVSAFRSDSEQARLWAQHPDPRWVAPPGTSLHRCGTELDLGPSTAYAWLAANAGRFGFLKRYPWEAWHRRCTWGNGTCLAKPRPGSVAGAASTELYPWPPMEGKGVIGRIGAHMRANVVAYVALFVALSGVAYAGIKPLLDKK